MADLENREVYYDVISGDGLAHSGRVLQGEHWIFWRDSRGGLNRSHVPKGVQPETVINEPENYPTSHWTASKSSRPDIFDPFGTTIQGSGITQLQALLLGCTKADIAGDKWPRATVEAIKIPSRTLRRKPGWTSRASSFFLGSEHRRSSHDDSPSSMPQHSTNRETQDPNAEGRSEERQRLKQVWEGSVREYLWRLRLIKQRCSHL
jgi:hypothetical protein